MGERVVTREPLMRSVLSTLGSRARVIARQSSRSS